MQYGVIIESGAVDWQLFQRDVFGRATITITGVYRAARLVPPPPFTIEAVEAENPVVSARVVSEETGAEVLPWQPACLSPGGRFVARLSDIPAGGPYRIETCLYFDGWDGYSTTRGDMVHHIGIGDIFAIAGQSNASGRAKTPLFDPPDPGVHLLRANGQWTMAAHPLNETTGAACAACAACAAGATGATGAAGATGATGATGNTIAPIAGHFENHNPGHSPFLAFAKALRRRLGVPIGLAVFAHGGTPFSWWNPDENGALTDNMIALLKAHGIRPKAVLWYQGEAEGYEDGSRDYLARFSRFVGCCRERLSMPALPFYTVQLARYLLGHQSPELDRHWGRMRQAQRDAMYAIDGVFTVPANDLPLYDTAHLSPEGNLRLAERLANAVLANEYAAPIRWRAPELISARRTEDGRIRVTFSDIATRLDVFDIAPERLPIEAEDEAGLQSPCAYTLERSSLLITFARPPMPGARLHGMWRMRAGDAIPQDLSGLPAMSFYGAPIEEGEEP